MKKSKILKSIIIIFSIIAIAVISFIVWTSNNYKPTTEAISILKNEENIDISEDDFITFSPKDKKIEKGFIFYPGGKVSEEAYSLLASGIAEEGYLVVIVPMPLDLAVFSPNKAEKVMEKYSDIETWAIGGHSLGGVMASKFASENPKIRGLALYASYPSGDELKDSDIEVVSIYGSEDGVADLKKVKGAILSKNSNLFEIKGGNHAQFGSYGEQEGDNKATISEEEQIREAVSITVKMLEKL